MPEKHDTVDRRATEKQTPISPVWSGAIATRKKTQSTVDDDKLWVNRIVLIDPFHVQFHEDTFDFKIETC